jgi:protein O-GlcNAc transferase
MSKDDRLFQNAVSHLKVGHFSEAEHLFRKVLKRQPKHVGALNLLTVVLMQTERFSEAERFARAAINIRTSDVTFYNLGIILKRLHRPGEAFDQFNNALALNGSVPETWNNRGAALNDMGRYGDAILDFDKAISLSATYPDAHCNKAKSLSALKRYDEALAAYEQALSLKPDLAEGWFGRGGVLGRLKRYDEAAASYERTLALKPDWSEAWVGRGGALNALWRFKEAVGAYCRAIALDSDSAETWLGYGNALLGTKSYDESLGAYDKSITLNPNMAEACLGRSNALMALKRYNEAVKSLTALAQVWPDFSFAKGSLLHAKMLCCDWAGLLELRESIGNDLHLAKQSAEPFGYQAISESEEDLHLCAKLYAQSKFPAQRIRSLKLQIDRNPKIRVGYLSGEFRQQATSSLLTELIELHDRNRFEIFAFDNGFDDRSELRARLDSAFDEIVNISGIGDTEAAETVARRGIDILINLNGYFGDARQGVFSNRPSPIQVNYLGFPGTIGAEYIDYLIADRVIIPEDSRRHYAEKVVYLPNCYQVNDRKRSIAERRYTRDELGLPVHGFVFCCFNNSYKIVPESFDCWMRILRRVDGSVLWLLKDNLTAADNLRKEAERRGIGAERLVFGERMPAPDHLARHRLADLFLDTLPYNAHTTASDALWAGLPVLTRVGNTFPGRVGASLLSAIRLPELITHTEKEYESVAVGLAVNPAKLMDIKERLASNRLATPLFDTPLFAKHIEAAYTAMHERYHAGLPPDHIHVEPRSVLT